MRIFKKERLILMSEMRKQLDRLLEPFKKVWVLRENINYMLMPVTKIELTQQNVNMINEITTLMHDNGFTKIRRTKSGGISIARSLWHPNCFDIRGFSAGIELTICAGYCLRIQLGHVDVNEDGKTTTISGHQAFNRFVRELKKDGIDIKDYVINNGEEVNEEIRKPRIKSYVANSDINECKVYENVHHIDFHKAYMSGLYLSHEELRPTIDRLYKLRHTDPTIKAVFTNTIGYFHSSRIHWKYANLAKDAINTFNEVMDKVAYSLVKSGRTILAYNTDGIWYEGDIYHGEYEGSYLGQWENDYTNCKIRFKSDGAYEFICNDTYYAKIRGKTKLDMIEPDRTKWHWGDIFSLDAVVLKYILKDGYLITNFEEEI